MSACVALLGEGEMTFDLWFLYSFYLDKYHEIGSPSSVRLCCCAINDLSSHFTHTHTHTHTHTRPHAHTHTRACTHTRTHAHAHTHRQSLRALWSWFSWRSGYMEEWLQSSSMRTSLTLCLTSSTWVVSTMDGVHMYRVTTSLSLSPPSLLSPFIRDLSRVAELRRLERGHSRKHHFVTADWVTDSIECEYTKNERFYEPRT